MKSSHMIMSTQWQLPLLYHAAWCIHWFLTPLSKVGQTQAKLDNLDDLEAIYYESAVILSWATSVHKS